MKTYNFYILSYLKMKTTINPKLITNKWFKNFIEILNEKLDELNDKIKSWNYILEIKKDYFWLYFKSNNWYIYQSLAFYSDLEIINFIKWNLNFYSIMK